MEFIKKIIREELEKVLSVLNETDFYGGADYQAIASKSNPKDNIIYNYEKGRMFAGNNLEVDISGLNQYQLREYLPKSPDEEMWSFELETVYGTTLIVDIKRIVMNEKSYWSMSFGQLYKDEQIPKLLAELNGIEGYDKFVSVVNQKMASKIDPSKY